MKVKFTNATSGYRPHVKVNLSSPAHAKAQRVKLVAKGVPPKQAVKMTPFAPNPRAPKVDAATGAPQFSAYRPRGFAGQIEQKVKMQLPRKGMQSRPEYEAYVQKLKDDCASIQRRHLRGMLAGVGMILHSPPFRVPDFWKPGRTKAVLAPQTYGYNATWSDPHLGLDPGQSVILQTGRKTVFKWKGLNPDYAKSQGRWGGLKQSKSFWRKQGHLFAAYNSWFQQALAQTNELGKFSNKGVHFTRAPRNGKVFEADFTLKTPRLTPYYMDYLLRYAFATRQAQIYRGIEKRYLFQKGGPYDLRRFLYPEYVRPWASLFAQRMGERSFASIKRRLS